MSAQSDAQTALASIVASMSSFAPKNKEVITLPINVVGALDFSVLNIANLSGIRKIDIPDGSITSISNIPQSVHTLCIGKNALINAPDLPEALTTLHIGTTPIARINLSACVRLTDICITRPKNEPNIDIIGIPPALVRIEHHGQPHIHQFAPPPQTIRGGTVAAKLTVEQALREYFRMKGTYEQRNLAERRKLAKISQTQLKQWNPRCVNCRNIGGTIFTQSRNEYSARCGALAKPCALDLRIATGKFISADLIMRESAEKAEEIKTRIIRQRMDAVFGYISESVAATEFEKAYAEYITATSKLADTRATIETGTPSDPEIQKGADTLDRDVAELIIHAKELCNRYYSTGDRSAMVEAVRIQAQDLAPAAKIAVKARFAIVEMATMPNGSEILVRHETTLNKRVINIGAEPAVITWIM